MTVKALRKQLMAAIAMVVVAAVALSSSTYAWFAANRIVTATNMQVSATTSGSLVISKGSLPTTTTTSVTVSSDDTDATDLICTHHDLTSSNTTGLVYNTNSGNVSIDTGLVADGKSNLTFSPAENGTPNGAIYYRDYTVYIAANGAALASQDITVTVTSNKLGTLMDATSIDFYYSSVSTAVTPTVSESTYAGTLNLAGKAYNTDDGNDECSYITLGTSGLDIPVASGSGAIAVLMRVYVDGGLKDTSTTTYIRSADSLDISNVTMAVKFEAADHT